MSFFTALHHLQGARVGIRRIILAATVFVFMALIIGIWILQLRGLEKVGIPQEEKNQSPFRIVWDTARDTIKETKKRFYGSQ